MRFTVEQRPLGKVPIGALLALPLTALPLGAYLVEHGIVDLGVCGMKKAFDIPCLSCGSTRATLHLFHGDIATALTLQPMMMFIYAILAVWGIVSFVSFARRKLVRMHLSDAEDIALKVGLVSVPLLNWGYLIWAGV